MTKTFSSKDFRDALGYFATGVCIATTTRGSERIGITINSFASVSLSPALVLFSVGRALHSFEVFEQATGFTINVLRQDQTELSSRFARAGEDKWKDVPCVEGAHGGVILTGALASFDCKRHALHEGGDHLVLVGEVGAIRVADGCDAAPLVYYRSAYGQLKR